MIWGNLHIGVYIQQDPNGVVGKRKRRVRETGLGRSRFCLMVLDV